MTTQGCTDCIVTLPAQPLSSLRVNVQSTKGYKGVLQRVESINGVYPANNILSEQLELVPNGVYTLTIPTQLQVLSLLVYSGPVTVGLTTGSGESATTVNLTANKVLVVDYGYSAVSITNPSATQNAKIAVTYASN